MRGLPPDSTLVLVNGKRRHRSSVITFLGNGLNDGAHGADLSAIPAIALDRVEVLRDNAGAQYGSDAVAGILNFVLKEDSEGGSVDVRWGQYYQGDGENITVSANVGLPLTENGFLNLSAEYNEADPTIRGTHSDRSNYLVNAGNMNVKDPPIVWGAPDIEDNYKLFANAAIGLGALHEAYAFGNYAERTVDGGFYFRSPRRRTGIFATGVVRPDDPSDEQRDSIVIDQMPWLDPNTDPFECDWLALQIRPQDQGTPWMRLLIIRSMLCLQPQVPGRLHAAVRWRYRGFEHCGRPSRGVERRLHLRHQLRVWPARSRSFHL